MADQQRPNRRLRALNDPQAGADAAVVNRAIRADDRMRRRLNHADVDAKLRSEDIRDRFAESGQALQIVRTGVDGAPLGQTLDHRGFLTRNGGEGGIMICPNGGTLRHGEGLPARLTAGKAGFASPIRAPGDRRVKLTRLSHIYHNLLRARRDDIVSPDAEHL
jgi:hypothetical protein